MNENDKYVVSRIKELSERAFNRGVWTFTDFLSLAEQSLVESSAESEYLLWGGYENAERKIAAFGSEELCGYKEELPIKIVKIEPVSKKFADTLTHRDFLGALMSLGVKREVTGDILIKDNIGYVLCINTISEFLRDSISQVKRTAVKCEILDELPEIAKSEPASKEILVSSERIDAVISAVFNLSRSEAKRLFSDKKIFSDSREVSSPAAAASEGSVISVRGKGRFKYNGIIRQTKKGRMSISVDIY